MAYPDLEKILEYLCNNEKIGYVLIVTNGTVYPKPSVIKWMKHPKVTVWVSCYAAVDTSEAREKLFSLLN